MRRHLRLQRQFRGAGRGCKTLVPACLRGGVRAAYASVGEQTVYAHRQTSVGVQVVYAQRWAFVGVQVVYVQRQAW
ncbi:hypothetical protein [Paenibacillus chitinolyticus]